MSTLRQSLADYLTMRREFGYKLENSGHLLTQFVTFCEESGVEVSTVDIALTWATMPKNCSKVWGALRLDAVRGFARYLHAFDSRTGIPPIGLLPGGYQRATPYLYSPDQIRALMTAARDIPSALRATTTEVIIGLLAASGLRIGEALALDRSDVNLSQGVLTIHLTKFNKTREVPLHPTCVAALRAYARQRDQLIPQTASPAFFVSAAGTRVLHCNFSATFRDLLTRVHIEACSASCRPRVHDLSYPNLNKIPTLAPKRCDSCQVGEKRLGFSFIVCSSLSIQRRAFPWTYKTYGITIPSFLPTWKTRATQNSTWHGSPGS